MPTEQNEPSDEMIKPSDANCVRQNFSLECRGSVCDEEREERKEKEKKRKQEERARTRVEITFFFLRQAGDYGHAKISLPPRFRKEKKHSFLLVYPSRLQQQQAAGSAVDSPPKPLLSARVCSRPRGAVGASTPHPPSEQYPERHRESNFFFCPQPTAAQI